MIEPRLIEEILLGGQIIIKVEMLLGHADAALHRHGVLGQIDAVDLHRSTVGLQQTDQHVDGGAFTGAIGAEQTKTLPGLHRQ